MNKTIKAGDIVRLTDPISEGQIVRIVNVTEDGLASWLGGAQATDMEQIPCVFQALRFIGENSLNGYYETLSEVVSDLESNLGIKLYPESAVEYWKNRAEKHEVENARNVAKIEKLQSELRRCRAKNAEYLTAKTNAENRAKLLEKEVSDLKVPESRQNRHLRDELQKVRFRVSASVGKSK